MVNEGIEDDQEDLEEKRREQVFCKSEVMKMTMQPSNPKNSILEKLRC